MWWVGHGCVRWCVDERLRPGRTKHWASEASEAVVILKHRTDKADVHLPQAASWRRRTLMRACAHLWVVKPDLFDHSYVAAVTLHAVGAEGRGGF